MSMDSENRRSAFITMAVLSLIAFTAFFLLRNVVPTILLLLLVPGSMFGIYAYVVYGYLQGQRGYHNRYEQAGQQADNTNTLFRYIVVFLAFLVVFVLLNSYLAPIFGIESWIVFGVTLLIFTVVVQVVDYYAGKDMEVYVEHKKKRHYEYVASLGLAEGKCMSCHREIGEEPVCPHCGYTRKKPEPEKSYTGN